MAKIEFKDAFNNRPKPVYFTPDTETVFVSQSEVKTSGLKYQLSQYGFDSLAQKMENLRDKFGYADCTHCNDFMTLQNKYVQGVEYFNNLPSEVRRQYHDIPAEFYMDIERNPQLAYEHGFISEEFYKSLDISTDKITSDEPIAVSNDTLSDTQSTSGQPQ